MNIEQARKNRTHLMNITDMIDVACEANDPADAYWGTPVRVMKVLGAYYGGPNVGDCTKNFDRVRCNA